MHAANEGGLSFRWMDEGLNFFFDWVDFNVIQHTIRCGHAAVACVQKSRKLCPNGVAAWERTGCAKIAVKCQSEEEMRTIYDKAIEKGLPVYLVEDAGRTQIAAGSRTVLGIGPCPTKVFDDVTSHLKLL